MLDEEIDKKRKELNESIEKEKNYNEVYRLSIELDELIAEFYKKGRQKKNKEKNNKILYMV